DDGSTDKSVLLVPALIQLDTGVRVVRLSRNFGKEAAMSAGLAHARGEAVIMLDADLQDPPELIPEMVKAWQEGFDVVSMRRRTTLTP
ncbi:glycosyltransferase, partial [Paenibacillus polymyxa]|nr:glycosyltransferase [Paenibacillus polymyxa]